jgi:hypothetical protein
MLVCRPEPAQPKTTSMGGPRSPEAMPESDPAYPILSGMLGVVPASRWTFARVAPNGGLVSPFGSHPNGKVLAWLADELRRQRTKCPIMPTDELCRVDRTSLGQIKRIDAPPRHNKERRPGRPSRKHAS